MKNNKLVYKSDLNYFSIFLFLCFIVWIDYLFFEEGYFIANFVFTIFMLFFIIIVLFKRVYFFEEYVKVIYPLNIIKTKVIRYEDLIKVYTSNGRIDEMIILYKVANKNKKITFENPDFEGYDVLRRFLKEKNITID